MITIITTAAASLHLSTPALAVLSVTALGLAGLGFTAFYLLLRACHRTTAQTLPFDVNALTAIMDAFTRLIHGGVDRRSPGRVDEPNRTGGRLRSRRRSRRRRPATPDTQPPSGNTVLDDHDRRGDHA